MTPSTEIAIRPASLPEKLEYARQLAESGLLPAAYRKQPANVLYAVEYGDMLGLAPIAAITGIHVIEGKPSASAALMSALVRRAGHRLRVFGDGEKAVAEITRGDDPEFTFRSEWTLQRARQAELLGKGTWKKYPAAMLKARAVSECARDACEEALLGMHYTPEELGAETDEDGTPLRVSATRLSETPQTLVPRSAASPELDWEALISEYETAADLTKLGDLWREAKRLRPNDNDLRVRIEDAAKRVPVVVQDGEIVEPEPVTTSTDPGITERQSKRLHAILTEGGINRETKLALLTQITQRDNPNRAEITSSSELTEAEAQTVIDKLAELAKHKIPLIEAVIEELDRPASDPS